MVDDEKKENAEDIDLLDSEDDLFCADSEDNQGSDDSESDHEFYKTMRVNG